jgi:uncharacterized protein YjbI with pentapeptide repeats
MSRQFQNQLLNFLEGGRRNAYICTCIISATFTKEANFSSATFTKEANFSSATFTKEANFSSATFTKVYGGVKSMINKISKPTP